MIKLFETPGMTVYNALMTARLGSYHLAPAVICSDAKFSKNSLPLYPTQIFIIAPHAC